MVCLPMRHRWLSFVLMACFAHAPVPWFHRHADLRAEALQAHLAVFHPRTARALKPEQGHWHILLLGTNLAGTPCQTSGDVPDSSGKGPFKQFPCSDSTIEGELSDLEGREHVVHLSAAHDVNGHCHDSLLHGLGPQAPDSTHVVPSGSTRVAYQARLSVWRL